MNTSTKTIARQINLALTQKQSVIAYIDGFNLYFGIKHNTKRNWQKYLWLDLYEFCLSLCEPHQELVEVKYFTTRIRNDPAKVERQSAFLDVVASSGNVTMFEGFFDKKRYYCHNCKESHQCTNCGIRQKKYTEKQTDVNLATELIKDALQDRFEVALLIGGDSDFVHPVKEVVRMGKHVHVVFPPDRESGDIKAVASTVGTIFTRSVRDSQYPDRVEIYPGVFISRPVEWA